jgi:hypothetical protein
MVILATDYGVLPSGFTLSYLAGKLKHVPHESLEQFTNDLCRVDE